MTIIEVLVQLRDDLKLWVANNLRTKVDKEEGKGLSSNDFTNEEKEKLAAVDLDAAKVIVDDELSSTSTNAVQNKVISAALSNKADKEHTHDNLQLHDTAIGFESIEINAAMPQYPIEVTLSSEVYTDLSQITVILTSDSGIHNAVSDADGVVTGLNSESKFTLSLQSTMADFDPSQVTISCTYQLDVSRALHDYVLYVDLDGEEGTDDTDNTVIIDDTLSISGAAAEARAVGVAIANLENTKVPTTRTINGKELTSDIVLTAEDIGIDVDNISGNVSDAVRYDTEQSLMIGQKLLARNNIGATGLDDIYETKNTNITFTWDGIIGERDTFEYNGNVYCKVSDSVPEYALIGSVVDVVTRTSDGQMIEITNPSIMRGYGCYSIEYGLVVERTLNCSINSTVHFNAPSTGVYFMKDADGKYQSAVTLSMSKTTRLRYTWDGNMNGKDMFVYSGTKNYYKISNEFLDFNLIGNATSKRNNDVNDNSNVGILLNGTNCYIIDNNAIVVTKAGACSISFSSLPLNYREQDVSFIAPSTGVYFMHYTDGNYYTKELELFANGRNGIYLNSDDNRFVVGATDQGVLTTKDNNGTIVEMATKDYVDNKISVIDSVIDKIDLTTDTTLNVSGKAADAKITGKAIADLNALINDVPEQIEQAIEDAITEVFAQNDEPIDAPEGSIWIDLDEDGAPNVSSKTSANVYVVDAGTADVTTVDFSQYKIGDVILITTS